MCKLCDNSLSPNNITKCDEPQIFDEEKKQCVQKCDEGMIAWKNEKGNWVCKEDCALKKPIGRSCARVINRTVEKTYENGTKYYENEIEELECEEGCSVFLTAENGTCMCERKCPFSKDV